MNKKRTMFLVIILSVFVLLLYVGVINRYKTIVLLDVKVTQDGSLDVALLEQQVLLWEKPALKADEYNVVEIKLQTDCDGGENYFFLPQYLDLSEVYAVLSYESDDKTDIFLDDTYLPEGTLTQIGGLNEGEHSFATGSEEIAFTVMKGSELPSIWLETELPMDYVLDEKGNATTGEIKVVSADGAKEFTGEMESFRGRGNSSWYRDKKSYGFTLSTASSLLGMTPGKSWVLLSGAVDETVIRNKIFLDMALELGLENAVESEFVDVYINGTYQGCYLLTEKIAVATGRMEIGDLEDKTEMVNEQPLWEYPRYIVGESQRKGYMIPENPQDISGGYLLEVEIYTYRYDEENSGFITSNGVPIVISAPNYASAEQVEYISSLVQAFENALYSPDGYNSSGIHYSEYIDMESFVLRYLMDEFSKNIDAGYSSYFFYKPQGEDKLYAGPVWDYDTGLGNNDIYGDPVILQDPEGMYVNATNWSAQFWAQEDFVEMCGQVYEDTCLPYLDYLTEEGLGEYIEAVYASAQMNSAYYQIEDLDEKFSFLKSFVEQRKEYLEEELISE